MKRETSSLMQLTSLFISTLICAKTSRHRLLYQELQVQNNMATCTIRKQFSMKTMKIYVRMLRYQWKTRTFITEFRCGNKASQIINCILGRSNFSFWKKNLNEKYQPIRIITVEGALSNLIFLLLLQDRGEFSLADSRALFNKNYLIKVVEYSTYMHFSSHQGRNCDSCCLTFLKAKRHFTNCIFSSFHH